MPVILYFLISDVLFFTSPTDRIWHLISRVTAGGMLAFELLLVIIWHQRADIK